eukprot:CAMPEP_0119565200 /NCGR_PEP_ID=MMETSP1352-20130426/29276_1 /TAXON_ID=265584 /ORGANISM="Stauroneis constricta, Strain CCMP1120" /LENGTH=70 /DNA_ID=CAMNT_0007614071 /DNA_START=144 /DNA_END=356 /DNA_ORIENTATION=+
MSQYEGPWPKCLGMSSERCVSYIEEYASGVKDNVVVMGVETKDEIDDFDKNRVLVFVDDGDVVVEIPHRG